MDVDYLCSVEYRKDGEEVLASYSSDYIYIFDPKARQPLKHTYRDWFLVSRDFPWRVEHLSFSYSKFCHAALTS